MRYVVFAAGVYTGVCVSAYACVTYACRMAERHFFGEYRP